MPQTKQTYVVGTEGAIWRRDDHTGSFYDISPNVNTATIWADVMAHKSDPDLVVAVGERLSGPVGGIESGIVVSQDGGTTWISPAGDWITGPKIFYDVWIVDDSLTQPTIWVASDYGKIYKSTDGGLTFNKVLQDIGISVPGDIQYTTSLHALSPQVCVVTGYQQDGTVNDFEGTGVGRVYVWRTTDGGNNWTKLNSGSTYSDRRLINTLSGTSTGYSHGIWISPDQSKIIVSTNYVQFVSTDITLVHANFVSVPQAAIRSNHHMTWYPDHDPAPSRFRRTGGAPSPAATITESIDVGATWVITRPGDTINTIFGAHFYSPQNGYYVQRTSDIYHTQNGGVTGTVIQNIPGINWTAIHSSEQDNTIYRLENCEGIANDQFVTDPNMAQYVGQVIVIDPPDQDLPATLCWEVYIHDTVVGTYDQPVPIIGSFSDCAECNPRNYELIDCLGNEASIFTDSDLSAYVGSEWPYNVVNGVTIEVTMVPCCGGEVFRFIIDTFNPALVPVWLQGSLASLPDVIKYSGLCFSLEARLVPYTIGQPAGYIDMPTDAEVTILTSNDCENAAIEDTDCECENIIAPLYGGVIQIESGCPDVCWVVREITPDSTLDLQEVSVTADFTDCDTCHAEEEPEPPKPCPRPVDPGYDTGLCDPNVVEKALCEHATMMYEKMMATRFGITYCCPPNEDSIIIQQEKIAMLLRTSENPTPDPCNPECFSYQIEIDPSNSAVTTYVDCFEEPQTIITTPNADALPTLVGFCALNTTPPTTVVTYPDNSTDTYILEPNDPCVPPWVDPRRCTGYWVRMTSYIDGGQVFRYLDCDGVEQVVNVPGGTKQVFRYSFCGLEGQTIERENPFAPTDEFIVESDLECGETPCYRYRITVNSSTAGDFRYIDCSGQPASVPYLGQLANQIIEICGEPGMIPFLQLQCNNAGCNYFSVVVVGSC